MKSQLNHFHQLILFILPPELNQMEIPLRWDIPPSISQRSVKDDKNLNLMNFTGGGAIFHISRKLPIWL